MWFEGRVCPAVGVRWSSGAVRPPEVRRRSIASRGWWPVVATAVLGLALVVGLAADARAQANLIPIEVPASGATGGNASPYPSTIEIAGVAGDIEKVRVRLFGVSHTFPDDLDILLEGPSGQTVLLLSDAGGNQDLVNHSLIFDDDAPGPAPNEEFLSVSVYQPTNYGGLQDTFPVPAPQAPHGETLSVLNGTSPNGTWSLFVRDDSGPFGADTGAIEAGWALEILQTQTETWRAEGRRSRADVAIPASPLLFTSGAADPYPSTLTVAGITGRVQRVIVELVLTHGNPDDVDILLVGPTGAHALLMSDAGGPATVTDAVLQLDDAAASPLPDDSGLVSGMYQPANYGASPDQFPAPAPAGPYQTSLSVFSGLDPNGTWQLFVVDDEGTGLLTPDVGTLTSWSLTFVTRDLAPTLEITSPTTDPTLTATSSFINLAGTAADDLGITEVTWRTGGAFGYGGTATGTSNWRIDDIPVYAGEREIAVTVMDTNGQTTVETLTVTVDELVYFLAEGATGSFFDLDVAVANPNSVDAPVTLTFLRPAGPPVVVDATIAAEGRSTFPVDGIPGLDETAVSAVVTSTDALPLLVERTMQWDGTHYGSHGEKAVTNPSRTWLFAEGVQGFNFFDTFVLLASANPAPTDVTLRFLIEGDSPIEKQVTVEPNARLTFYAGLHPDLTNRSFSIVVESDLPIIAERAVYFGSPVFNGGHESAGVTEPSTSWFLAEGATANFFDMFVLGGNPNPEPVAVTLTYFTGSGDTIQRVKNVPANGRLTVDVAQEDPLLVNATVSVQVDATLPIVVERAMYWPVGAWYEAHNSFGLTATGTRWGLAEGRAGGPDNAQTFILLANPTDSPADVAITYLRESGAPITRTHTVAPNSRFTVFVNGDVPALDNQQFGALVVANVPIAVERAMYGNAGGVVWAAGTNATAARLPPPGF